ncbi:hypothetical protein PR048_026781 [Dryococelus australis]|uniref:SPIN-DOC-like zinc-finger domain-containing protein n=1 Tax=Dryococelus australis TaxID=614101 RepID=A0ABQ9GMD3_9NEOP|nr:hypothetical protein PR048_026781 [Dryococelus australis]
MSVQSKKRKVDSECCVFNYKWCMEYFVIEKASKVLCMICNELIAVLKEYNIRRHYKTKHDENFDKFKDKVHEHKFETLKCRLCFQQNIFKKHIQESEAVTRVSLRIAREIAIRALDKSTDVSDTAQVLLCFREVNSEVTVELADLISLHSTTTGGANNLSLSRLKCVTTDDRKNMCATNKGFIGRMKAECEASSVPKLLTLHCILHHEALCVKSVDMCVMNLVITVAFLEEVDSLSPDLPNHTAVRGLSCGKILSSLFPLRTEIEIFLNEKERSMEILSDKEWLWKLAFLVDVALHLNEQNKKLQGKNNLICDLYTHLKAFHQKLLIFEQQISQKTFAHFVCCQSLEREQDSKFPLLFAKKILGDLKEQF